jgi:hypothetical protein
MNYGELTGNTIKALTLTPTGGGTYGIGAAMYGELTGNTLKALTLTPTGGGTWGIAAMQIGDGGYQPVPVSASFYFDAVNPLLYGNVLLTHPVGTVYSQSVTYATPSAGGSPTAVTNVPWYVSAQGTVLPTLSGNAMAVRLSSEQLANSSGSATCYVAVMGGTVLAGQTPLHLSARSTPTTGGMAIQTSTGQGILASGRFR